VHGLDVAASERGSNTHNVWIAAEMKQHLIILKVLDLRDVGFASLTVACAFCHALGQRHCASQQIVSKTRPQSVWDSTQEPNTGDIW
jgi:hypothetical protein